jgi:hypothetical protein
VDSVHNLVDKQLEILSGWGYRCGLSGHVESRRGFGSNCVEFSDDPQYNLGKPWKDSGFREGII